jgi:carbonic anhydrase
MRSSRSTADRRSVLRWAAVLGGGAVLAACASKDKPTSSEKKEKDDEHGQSAPPATARHEAPAQAVTADQALAKLKEGNARFVAGGPTHPDQTAARRTELAGGQHPFALIHACVDSRVPPEVVFDQGLGDLFVIRTAGQVLDRAVRGSIEYGVLELKIPLLVVLGHEKCGAVKATLEAVEKKAAAMGNDIDALVEGIKPAVEHAESQHSADPLDAAVRFNVANVVADLGKDVPLANAVRAGTLRIVGARYDLDTGAVEYL